MYGLLEKYKTESAVLCRAYKLNEYHYLFLHKILTYPLIILSTFSSVIAGLRRPELEYVILAISLVILILSGFNTVINPKAKEFFSNKISNEFNDLALNINQFIIENNKSKDEIKIYSQKTLELFEIWKSMAPEIPSRFTNQAKIEIASQVKKRNSESAELSKKTFHLTESKETQIQIEIKK